MAKNRDYNIDAIYYGAIIDSSASLTPSSIDITSDYTELTNLVPDTIANVSEEPELTTFNNAENDKVDFEVVSNDAIKKFEFATRDQDGQNMLLAFGGTFSDGVWKAPVETFAGVEKSLILVSRTVNGVKAYKVFPRVKMTAMRQEEYNGTTTNNIMFKVTVLSPVDDSSGNEFSNEMIFYKAIAPVTASYISTTGVLTFDYVEGFDDVTDYEYSEDSGTTYSAFSSNPETITTALTAGDVLIRVAGYTSTDASEAQWQDSDSLAATVS